MWGYSLLAALKKHFYSVHSELPTHPYGRILVDQNGLLCTTFSGEVNTHGRQK